jgi:hypothetical protein
MSFGKILNRQGRTGQLMLIGMVLSASMVSGQFSTALAEMASSSVAGAGESIKPSVEANVDKDGQSDGDSDKDDLEKQEKKRLKQLKKMEKAQRKEEKRAAKEKDEEAVSNQSESKFEIESKAKSVDSDKQSSHKTDSAAEQMQESSAHDAAVRDAAVKDAAVKEAAVKDAAVKEAAVKDAAVKDGAIKDSAVKDSAVKGPRTVSDITIKKEKIADETAEAKNPRSTGAFLPDSALLSVLRDVAKELRETQAVKSIADPAQRMVVDLVQEVMNKAVNDAKHAPNRIVEGRDQNGRMPAMTTEAWASGDIALSSSCHSSLAAVWAKRENGLLNITIAGRCLDRSTPGGKQLGEFVVVVSGRSSIEHGFDIQSQSNVHFWLGKISTVTVESDGNEVSRFESRRSANIDLAAGTTGTTGTTAGTITSASATLDTIASDYMVLPAVLTERSRKYITNEHELSLHNHDLSRQSTTPAQIASFVASTTLPNGMTVQELQEAYQKALRELASRSAQAEAEKAAKSTIGSAFVSPDAKLEPLLHETSTEKKIGQLSFSTEASSIQLPSMDAFLIAPERALAGQSITVFVMDGKHNGEASVELSFNGKTAVTDMNGQHTFLVPEDAIPGHSLNVTLAARPENFPTTVEIFQPLTTTAEKQPPKIERVVSTSSHLNTIVVDGHNFDGLAGNDKVNVDGQFQGRILAASPVQLRINLPINLQAGEHTLFVTCQGMTSNSVNFHIQSTTSAQSNGSKTRTQKLAGSTRLVKRRGLAL